MESSTPCNTCLENIQHKQPPVYCGTDYCSAIAEFIEEYCMNTGWPPGTPIPQFIDGKTCWCCCGAFLNPALAVDEGAYQRIDELSPGDSVMVTGRSLDSWTKEPIQEIATLQALEEQNWAIRLHVAFSDGSDRSLTVGAEALMLMADGKLKPAGRCLSRDKLREAGGGEAEVRYSELVSDTIRHPNMGALDVETKDPLKGHLLDVLGLVVADLAVQTAAFTRQLPDALLAPLRDPPTEPLQFRSDT